MFYPKEELTQASHIEAELIRDYGKNSLALFGLNEENEHFLAPGGEGIVSYRLVGNVVVVLGDPVCPPQVFEQVTENFLNFCARQDWRVAFYQASPEHLATYHALNLHAFKMGEEAVLHPQTFTLSGSAIANVRTSSRRAEREGIMLHWYESVPPTTVMRQLEQVSNAWLEHKGGEQVAETGFSTGRLDDLIDTAEQADAIANLSLPSPLFRRAIPRFVTEVATTSSGDACAFVTFTPIYGCLTTEATAADSRSEVLGTDPSLQRHCVGGVWGTHSEASPSAAMQGEGWGWALDLMRRAPNAPPGVMELLLVRALERFRSYGAQVVSLGMVAMADTKQEMTAGQRQLASFVADRLHLLEGRQTLFNFKQKFHPDWQSRYLVTSTMLALPKIALAVLRLRNYSSGGLVRLVNG